MSTRHYALQHANTCLAPGELPKGGAKSHGPIRAFFGLSFSTIFTLIIITIIIVVIVSFISNVVVFITLFIFHIPYMPHSFFNEYLFLLSHALVLFTIAFDTVYYEMKLTITTTGFNLHVAVHCPRDTIRHYGIPRPAPNAP